MFKRILVPLDGSNFAEHALPRALELARRFEATLEVASVAVPYGGFPPPVGLPGEVSMDSFRDQMGEYLKAVEKRVKATGYDGAINTTVIPAGNVVRSMIRHIAERQVDLVVMTTHGRGWVGRAWLGSTADGMIRSAPCPLLLVRPTGKETEGAQLGDTPAPFMRVLVPLDGSKAGERLVSLADSIGGDGATKLLLRVVPPRPTVGYAPYLPDVVQEEHDHEMAVKEAGKYLEGLVQGSAGAVEVKVLDSLPPSEGILKVAEKDNVDLIAMSTAGRGGVARLLIGSVADKVVRRSAVPVLLYREAEKG